MEIPLKNVWVLICDALRDLVSVTISRLYACSNAYVCMLMLFSTSLLYDLLYSRIFYPFV